MKVLMIFGIVILALVVIIVLVGGYFGFVPGVSNLFGSNKPRDLGASFTQSEYQSAQAKVNFVNTDLPSDLPPKESIKYSGSHPVNTTLTQAEFNSLMNNRQWKYYPLKNAQVRVNPDGTAEFSANIVTGRLKDYALASGASENSLGVLSDYISKVPGEPALYAKFKGAIVNGQITGFEVMDFQVGKLTFTDQVKDNQGSVQSMIQSQLNSVPGFSVKNCRLVNGQIQFEGTLPNSVARSKE